MMYFFNIINLQENTIVTNPFIHKGFISFFHSFSHENYPTFFNLHPISLCEEFKTTHPIKTLLITLTK
jgi:hypothetical protein